MNSNKTILFTCLLCLLSLSGFTQANFIEAVIVTSNDETISGFIDYKNWEKNPRQIFFKDQVGQVSTLGALDLKSFKVADEWYWAQIIKVDKSPFKLSQFQTSAAEKIQLDTVFLQAIVIGEASLFYLKDEDSKRHYFLFKDSIKEELIVEQKLVDNNGKKLLKERKKYIGQLNYYLNDCPEVASSILHARYEQKSLQQIVQKYNESMGHPIIYIKAIEKTTLNFGLVLGGSSIKPFFDTRYYGGAPYTDDYRFSIRPYLGLMFNVILPRSHQKWNFYNELAFRNFYTKSPTSNLVNFPGLKVLNGVRYHFSKGKIRPFAMVGMSNNFLFDNDNSDWPLEYFRKHEEAISVSLGAKYRIFNIEVRYEQGTGISYYRDIPSGTQSFYFLLTTRLL